MILVATVFLEARLAPTTLGAGIFRFAGEPGLIEPDH